MSTERNGLDQNHDSARHVFAKHLDKEDEVAVRKFMLEARQLALIP